MAYENGKYYKCSHTEDTKVVVEGNNPSNYDVTYLYTWVEATDENLSDKYAVSYEESWTTAKEKCTAQTCKCQRVEVHEGSLIPGDSDMLDIETSYISYDETCPTSSIIETKGIEVFAAEEETTTSNNFVFDAETGVFSGFTPGIYSFEYDGDNYLLDYSVLEYEVNDGVFSLYVDLDGDGEIDKETEQISDDTVLLTIETILKGFTYSLKEGFNFVSLPFIFDDSDISMASDLLNDLNTSYGDIFLSLSKYDSGKWTMVGSNSGDYDNNDFQLLPGQGYVLKVSEDVDITIYGHEVEYDSEDDSAPISFSEGWNLVGLYGSNVTSYTAESLLEDITKYDEEDFTAVNVSRWVESKALYEALQREEDSTGTTNVYGLDFPIELKKSYFIKVTEGSGNWEPDIE